MEREGEKTVGNDRRKREEASGERRGDDTKREKILNVNEYWGCVSSFTPLSLVTPLVTRVLWLQRIPRHSAVTDLKK